MRVTIIPSDNRVIIGEKSIKFDLSSFEIDSNYHAIQWDGAKGIIETKEGKNIKLTSLDELEPILNEHANRVAAEAALLEAEEAASIPLHKKTYREQRVAEGITISGVTVATDNVSQQRLIAIRVLAKEDDNYTVNWKTENGFQTLNASQIIAVADAVRTHVQQCFDAEAAIADITYNSKAEVETAFDAAYVGE